MDGVIDGHPTFSGTKESIAGEGSGPWGCWASCGPVATQRCMTLRLSRFRLNKRCVCLKARDGI